MAVYLFNKAYFTEHSVVDSNVDYTKIKPFIQIAQDLDLLPLIGTDLMNKLKADVTAFEDSATPIPALYLTLLETYVQPALLHYALGRSTPTIKLKYAAKGVMVKNSENSNPADSIDIDKQVDEWKNVAQEYAKRMKEYLNFNTGNYPEYFGQSGTSYKVFPRQDVFEVSIFLPGAPRNLTIPEYYKTRFDEG